MVLKTPYKAGQCMDKALPRLEFTSHNNLHLRLFQNAKTMFLISIILVCLLSSPQVKCAAMNSFRETAAKELMDDKVFRRISDNILPHILRLYGSTATARDFDMYAPNATFEDPLMCAHGVKQIKSAFYSLSKIFTESKIVEYTIRESVDSPGKGKILIDNKQHYKIMGKTVDMISLITLHIDGGKVVRHEDWWDKKPLWNRDTVKTPLVGRLVEMTRRGSMLTTHVMMRFGKDPSA